MEVRYKWELTDIMEAEMTTVSGEDAVMSWPFRGTISLSVSCFSGASWPISSICLSEFLRSLARASVKANNIWTTLGRKLKLPRVFLFILFYCYGFLYIFYFCFMIIFSLCNKWCFLLIERNKYDIRRVTYI